MIPFAGIILLVLAGYWVWNSQLNLKTEESNEPKATYEEAIAQQEKFEQAMRNDTYGGKTPQETLNLFIEALQKSDVELAYQYFILKENGERDPKWMEGLIKTRDAGRLQEVADSLSKAKSSGSSIEGYYGFVIEDSQKEVIANIELRFNQYSGVWKIESL